MTRIFLFACLLLLSVAIGACSGPVAEPAGDDVSFTNPAETDAGGVLSLSLTTYASGFTSPVSMTNAGDDRLFVVEQAGVIRIIDGGGNVLPTPFLDISDRVDSSGDEEGLLGLVFHQNYAGTGYFYVNYTNTTSGTRRTRISRFSVTGDPNIADPNSENILLTVVQPYSNHNAGDIHFGPDGYLYIPLGDGGLGGDPDDNAQNPENLLGAVSRIDVNMGSGASSDCVGDGSGDYTIPNDNPFIDGAGGDCDELWVIGMRNPWRSSFDKITGDFFIGDVGQGSWEEVDYQPASSNGGENYGWRCYEGNHPYNTSGCGPMGNYDFPIFEYVSTGNCAVVGGYVYRGSIYPAMVGRYFLTDYCTGNFWDLESDGGGGWNATQHTNLQQSGFTTFGEGNNGELYVALRSGTIYHLEEAVAVTPTPTTTPPTPTATATATATATNTATATATATGTAPATPPTATATGTAPATPPTATATATGVGTPSATLVGTPTATATPFGTPFHLPIIINGE